MKDIDKWVLMTRLNSSHSKPKIPSYSFRGMDNKIPSRDTGGGSTAKSLTPVYTGDKIIGIGTMHKSNAVPIFSKEDAEDISKMRR